MKLASNICLLKSIQLPKRIIMVFQIHSGNVYKMSRNKDRYESSNNRRQQIFMSQEDVAAGRKSNWTGVEITGNYISINSSLFSIHLLEIQTFSFACRQCTQCQSNFMAIRTSDSVIS